MRRSYRYMVTYKPNKSVLDKMFKETSYKMKYINEVTEEAIQCESEELKENIKLAVKFYQSANVFNKSYKITKFEYYKEERDLCYNAYIYYRDKSLQLDCAAVTLIKTLYDAYQKHGINIDGKYYQKDLPRHMRMKIE